MYDVKYVKKKQKQRKKAITKMGLQRAETSGAEI